MVLVSITEDQLPTFEAETLLPETLHHLPVVVPEGHHTQHPVEFPDAIATPLPVASSGAQSHPCDLSFSLLFSHSVAITVVAAAVAVSAVPGVAPVPDPPALHQHGDGPRPALCGHGHGDHEVHEDVLAVALAVYQSPRLG